MTHIELICPCGNTHVWRGPWRGTLASMRQCDDCRKAKAREIMQLVKDAAERRKDGGKVSGGVVKL